MHLLVSNVYLFLDRRTEQTIVLKVRRVQIAHPHAKLFYFLRHLREIFIDSVNDVAKLAAASFSEVLITCALWCNITLYFNYQPFLALYIARLLFPLPTAHAFSVLIAT
jgi:hypothetical protein